MKELSLHQHSIIRSVDDLARISKVFAASGYFKDAKDAAQAGVKIMAGQELGIGAFTAMTGLHIIEGRIEIGAHIIAAAFRRHPRYDYAVKKLTPTEVVIGVLMDGMEIGRSSFGEADAKRAGLLGKHNWRQWPINMLFSRAISNAHRFFAPDLFYGAPVYVEGEISGGESVPTIDDLPEVQEAEERQEQQAAPAGEAATEVVTDEEAAEVLGETPEAENPDKITAGQVKALSIALREAGFDKNKKEKGRHFLAYLAGIKNLELESVKDLTKNQASAILDALGDGTNGNYRADPKRIEKAVQAWVDYEAGLEYEERLAEETNAS